MVVRANERILILLNKLKEKLLWASSSKSKRGRNSYKKNKKSTGKAPNAAKHLGARPDYKYTKKRECFQLQGDWELEQDCPELKAYGTQNN